MDHKMNSHADNTYQTHTRLVESECLSGRWWIRDMSEADCYWNLLLLFVFMDQDKFWDSGFS